MFQIYDGRKHFYQWDLNQKLIVNDETITEVHFCNGTDDCALICEVYSANGLRLVNVPNILFQSDWRIKVWGYAEDHTKHEATFKVCGRTKPADYIYTETEVKSYENYEERLAAIEEDYITSTDIATDTKAGLVKIVGSTGIAIGPSHTLCINPASEADIRRRDTIKPITTTNLEYAVKNVGDGYYATVEQIGDIDRALINIMNIQGSYLPQGYSVMTLEEGEVNE